MHVENKKDCTGCGACFNICPKNAISMQWDKYGFYKPSIDSENCINCGLCGKVCPLDKTFTQEIEPKVFALQIKDEEQLYKSASGGAFPLFAKYIIKQGGVVYGVIYDEEMKVCHSRTETIEGLEKMYSSKYVQSNTKNTFKQTKDDLEQGRLVLYSGTPCQIAGLKSFLQQDYDNLLTVDLVCHGSQSPLFFEKYKNNFLKNRKDEKLLNINFRSKKAAWGSGYFTTTTTTKGIYDNPSDYYTSAMDLSINNSCVHCLFNKIPRVADITIGDFWGIDEFDKSLNNKKGTSIILVNNFRGSNFFDLVKEHCYFKDVPLDVAIKRNPNIRRSTIAKPKREAFLEDICVRNKDIEKCANVYLRVPLYIKIYHLLPISAKDFIKYKILKKEK